VLSWIKCIGRYDHAIGYSALFWPDFVIHDDCLFLDPPDIDNLNAWMSHFKGDKTAVESIINHRHIVSLFLNSEFEPTEAVVVHLGRLPQEMWSCKLARDFPDRRAKAKLSDAGGDLLAYEITVYQQRE